MIVLHITVVLAALSQSVHSEASADILQAGLSAMLYLGHQNGVNRATLSELGACKGVSMAD